MKICVPNALIEYSVSGKSDIRRQGSGMVAELDIGNLFLGDLVLSDFNSLTRASAKGIGMHAYRIAVNLQSAVCRMPKQHPCHGR